MSGPAMAVWKGPSHVFVKGNDVFRQVSLPGLHEGMPAVEGPTLPDIFAIMDEAYVCGRPVTRITEIAGILGRFIAAPFVDDGVRYLVTRWERVGPPPAPTAPTLRSLPLPASAPARVA